MAEQLTTDNAPSWSQWVTNFDTAYKGFNDNYAGLMAQAPYIQQSHPELTSWYNDLVSQAQDAAAKLQALQDMRNTVADALASIGQGIQAALQFTGANDAIAWAQGVAASAGQGAGNVVNSVENWFSQTFGGLPSTNIRQIPNLPNRQLGGLGFLPLLPLGIVAAAGILAVAALVVAKMYAGAQRLNALKQLESQGYSASAATAMVNQSYGDVSTSTIFGIDYKFVLLAVLGIVALPKLLDLMKGRK